MTNFFPAPGYTGKSYATQHNAEEAIKLSPVSDARGMWIIAAVKVKGATRFAPVYVMRPTDELGPMDIISAGFAVTGSR